LGQTPDGWIKVRDEYRALEKAEKTAVRMYQRTVDEAYEQLPKIRGIIESVDALAALEGDIRALADVIKNDDFDPAMDKIKDVENLISSVEGASSVKSSVSKARRALRGDSPHREKGLKELDKALAKHAKEVAWRTIAAEKVLPALIVYDDAIKNTIGARLQPRLQKDQALAIAACRSNHKDISLSF